MWYFFAVNKDGTEVCSNEVLSRFNELIKTWNEIDRKKGCLESELYDETDEKYCYWTNQSSNYNTEIYDGLEYFNTVTELPKGSIKLLTGKDITWEDKPIFIDM